MKIISGKLKGRKILTKKNFDYRPTKSAVKEALFSILSSGNSLGNDSKDFVKDANVLDVFAGTGALGFEAMSRGAGSLTFVEKNSINLEMLKHNASELFDASDIEILHADATKLREAKRKKDLIFLDPPFYKDLVEPTIKSLTEHNWLANNAVVVIETQKNETYTLPENFIKHVERIYGCARLRIYIYNGKEGVE